VNAYEPEVPLNKFDSKRHAFAFSTLRSPGQRVELWEAFRDFIRNFLCFEGSH